MDNKGVKIKIVDLNLSNRTTNALLNANIKTLKQLLDMKNYDFLQLDNIGKESLREIQVVLEGYENIIKEYQWRQKRIQEITKLVDKESIEFLNINSRSRSALKQMGVYTVSQLIRLTRDDLNQLKNIGQKSLQDIQDEIERILHKEYTNQFNPVSFYYEVSPIEKESQTYMRSMRRYDFKVIDLLIREYHFKAMHLAEWYGISRQGVYNALTKKNPKRRDSWCHKEFTSFEYGMLDKAIENQKLEYQEQDIICHCLNDRKEKFACLFVYEKEIKCFFLKSLPPELQQKIKHANFHRFTDKELAGESDGSVIHILKKKYFLPKHPDNFCMNAQLRGITINSYAEFISGLPLGDTRNVTDDQIIEFLKENLIDGKVYISSDPKNQWIRSLASRNGYSIQGMIELFGFKSYLDRSEVVKHGREIVKK